MRVSACIPVLALSTFAACGGSAPPPKMESEPLASTESQPESKAGESKPEESAAAPAPSPPPAPAKPDATTSLEVPKGDDPWLASHQMPPGDVLKTVRMQQARVQACFRAGKQRDPSVAGEVKIRFVITNDGKVRDWRDEASSMSDEEVTSCVGEVIKTLRFPRQLSPGDAWGSYAINFTP
jgi:hypothetical protein